MFNPVDGGGDVDGVEFSNFTSDVVGLVTEKSSVFFRSVVSELVGSELVGVVVLGV